MRTLRFYFSLLLLSLGAHSLAAQTNFAVLASDGAWTWYNDPRAVFHNGSLYFGYVRNADGKSVLSALNLATGKRTELWSSVLSQKDDHNNPAVLVKEDGKLLAIHARHNSDQFFSYRLSSTTNPTTPGAWSQEFTNATGAGVTYANPFQLSSEGGRIYNFTRNQNFNPTVLTSTNGGQSWSSPQLFIKTGTGGIRPYVKYSSDYRDRIDFLYTDGHPRNLTNSLYHCFYRSNHLYKTDGTLLKSYSALPILHDSGERGSVIYQYSDAPSDDPNIHIPTGRAWCTEIVNQANGAPVALFTVQRDQAAGPTWTGDRIYYYYARWTGSNWQKRFIAHAGRPLYEAEDDYPGGICADPENPNIIYISSNAQNPFDLTTTTNVPLRNNSRYELYRGTTTDGGLSFSWEAVTTNSAMDNLRPYVPRHHEGAPALIWFRGNYTTFTSYDCEVVGLFSQAIPQTPKASLLKPSRALVAFTNLDNQLKVSALVADDGAPQPATFSWTTVAGPTNAVFSAPASTATSVHFPAPGEYTLRFTADDTIAADSVDAVIVAGSAGLDDASDPSRVLWLKLDETSGTAVLDHSAGLNNGTVSGNVAWRPTTGMRKGALELDGHSGEVVVSDADTLDGSTAFTLAFWFLAKSYPGDSGGLVSKRNGAGDNNAYTTYLKTADRKIYVDIVGGNNRFASLTSINTNEWYHVAVVFDGTLPTAQRARLWINGQLDVTASETSSAIPNYLSSLRVGNTHPGATNWLHGLFDDVQFLRRALTATEIRTLAVRHRAPSIILAPAPSVISGIETTIAADVESGSGGTTSSRWQLVQGFDGVRLADPMGPTTAARFPRAGNYLLEIVASNELAEVSGQLPITVGSNTNVFEDWAAFYFPDQPSAVRDETADPDLDGVLNILEFAYGLQPGTPDSIPYSTAHAGLPQIGISNIDGTNFLVASVRRPIGRLGLNVAARTTGDFSAWNDAVPVGAINNGDGTELLTLRDAIAVSGEPHRFLKLEVSRISF